MSDHYTEAKRLMETGNLADHDKALVHAFLYLGEQIENLTGILSESKSGGARPDPLTREEYGLTDDRASQ